MRSIFSKAVSALKEKQLKMVWEITKGRGSSYLVGTAHFFPYSFQRSLNEYVSNVDTVLIEGPLDEDTMSKVVESGTQRYIERSLYNVLSEEIRDKIVKELSAPFRCRSTFFRYYGHVLEKEANDSISSMLNELRPWLAFFSIWYQFLRMRGWGYSMDKDAYRIANEIGKRVSFLERVDEQIAALEQIPVENIARFLGMVEEWKEYTDTYVKIFLKGDLDRLMTKAKDFPTRCKAVIDDRDKVLYERMKSFIEHARSLACVGITHIQGIQKMLEEDGFSIRQLR